MLTPRPPEPLHWGLPSLLLNWQRGGGVNSQRVKLANHLSSLPSPSTKTMHVQLYILSLTPLHGVHRDTFTVPKHEQQMAVAVTNEWQQLVIKFPKYFVIGKF
jgi:hypothetical protein